MITRIVYQNKFVLSFEVRFDEKFEPLIKKIMSLKHKFYFSILGLYFRLFVIKKKKLYNLYNLSQKNYLMIATKLILNEFQFKFITHSKAISDIILDNK